MAIVPTMVGKGGREKKTKIVEDGGSINSKYHVVVVFQYVTHTRYFICKYNYT